MCREIAELDDEAQIVDNTLVDKGGKGRIVDERREIVLVWQTQGAVHGVEPLDRELRTFSHAERTERGTDPDGLLRLDARIRERSKVLFGTQKVKIRHARAPFINDRMRISAKQALDDLFLNRMCRHSEYFTPNDILMDAHRYCIELLRCCL